MRHWQTTAHGLPMLRVAGVAVQCEDDEINFFLNESVSHTTKAVTLIANKSP